ncbi:MAG: hypothetical protein ACT4RN_11860 [Pseudonocardia sp.]
MTRSSATPRMPAPAGQTTSPKFAGVAYAVFAAAFAVGTLIHEFQSTIPWWMAVPVATAAFWVLLRPAATARLVLLLALLAAECVVTLPSPSNHQILVGILGLAVAPWWVAWRLRDPVAAADPGEFLQRAGGFLRVCFILFWAFAALAKFNSGFLDVAASCSVWMLESVPLVDVPRALTPLVIVGTILVEALIPLLLLFHRTRPLAIVLAFGFHAVSAVAGHSSFSGFAWSMYVLFLPPAMLARAVVAARRALPEPARRGVALAVRRAPVALAVLVGGWAVVRYGLVSMLPDSLKGGARHWGAVLLCLAFMGVSGWALLRLRRHWLPTRGPRASLRVTSVVMLLGIGLVVFTAAMPYLGLKTRAAFTMFSNMQTEPGQWNHVLVPEAFRVFDWQDGGEVAFLDTDDPQLAAHLARTGRQEIVLLGARQSVADFPDAVVRYRLDGVERVAAPVSADPVLGAPLTPAQRWFGAIRPNAGGTCQQ